MITYRLQSTPGRMRNRWLSTMLLCLFGLLCNALAVADAPKSGEVRTNPKDGAQMVWIPACEFKMGVSETDLVALKRERPDYTNVDAWIKSEMPQHTVKLDGYWMYKYEVTVAQFKKFCLATKRAMPEIPAWDVDNFPMVNVTWEDATAYCVWAGVRLPTEAEWENAARGGDERRFPWGNAWETERCNNMSDHNEAGGGNNAERAAPVGSFSIGISPYGIEDMSGNVWEWCEDWYGDDYYAKSPLKNPQGPEDGDFRVMRGGSWGSTSRTCRATMRHYVAPDMAHHDDGGFRCAATKVPTTAVAEGLHGTVVVSMDVTADGTVIPESVKLVQRSYADSLDNAAAYTARSWKFTPAMENGIRVKSTATLKFEFTDPKNEVLVTQL